MYIAGDLVRRQLHHLRQGQLRQQLRHFRTDQVGAQDFTVPGIGDDLYPTGGLAQTERFAVGLERETSRP